MSKRPLTEKHKEMFKIPFHFIFSGIESKNHFHLAEQAGVKHFLTAILHAKKALGKKAEMERRFKDKGYTLMVDSSTYTFHSQIEEYGQESKYPLEYWENFLQDYLDWVEKNKEYISFFVELDITGVVGQDIVLDWRKNIIEPFEDRTGIPCLYMWQPQYDLSFWEEMCKRYHFVGFSGEAGISDKQVQSMLKTAKKHNTLTHGMAFTKIEKLRTGKYPFWSVDSTTWKMAERFGVTFIWDGKNFLQFDKTKKHTRKKYKRIMQKQGIDWDKIKADDASENTKMALIAWRGVSDWLSDYYTRTGKCYWLEDKETARKKEKEYIDTPLESRDPIFPPPEERWEETTDLDWEEVAESMNINPKCEEMSIVLTIVDILNACIHDKSEEHQANLVDILGKNEAIVDYIFDVFLTGKVEVDDSGEFLEVPSGVVQMMIDDDVYDKKELTYNKNSLRKLSALYKVADEVIYQNAPYFQGEAEIEEERLTEPEEREVYAGDEDRRQLALIERDENGRFKSGNLAHLKRSKSLMSNMPKLACDTCYLADNCPHFKPKAVCYYNKELNKFDTRNVDDVVEMQADMVNMNAQRLMMARIFEITDGGMPDRTVTDLINMQMGLLQQQMNLHKAMNPKLAGQGQNTIQVTASGDTGNSILSKLFGNLGGDGEAPVERKEVAPEQPEKTKDFMDDFIDADFIDLTEAEDELADNPEWIEEKEDKKKKKRKKVVKKKKKGDK
jgi:hypothetical protein